MNEIILMAHVFFGVACILATLWVLVETLNVREGNLVRLRWVSRAAALFLWLAMLVGGYWYVVDYPADKAVRVASYCRNLRHDVEVIAHSCGVPHPRRLRRFHVRIVCPDGVSRPLNELYPTNDPADASASAAKARALVS